MPKVLTAEDIAAFRERLCDVAEDKFAAHGADGVTLRELADALGVSPMTPYRYFTDKDAILAAVRARAFTRFAEAMEEAETKRSVRKTAFTGVLYVDWAMANPAAYRLMFDTQQPTASNYPELVAAMSRAPVLEVAVMLCVFVDEDPPELPKANGPISRPRALPPWLVPDSACTLALPDCTSVAVACVTSLTARDCASVWSSRSLSLSDSLLLPRTRRDQSTIAMRVLSPGASDRLCNN